MIFHPLDPFLPYRWQINQGSSMYVLSVVIGDVRSEKSSDLKTALGSAICLRISGFSVQHRPLGLPLVIHSVVQPIFYASLLRGEGIQQQDPKP